MAARPIWTGTLSFGLLNVPVQLMTGERRSELHFRMLDGRNNAAVKCFHQPLRLCVRK